LGNKKGRLCHAIGLLSLFYAGVYFVFVASGLGLNLISIINSSLVAVLMFMFMLASLFTF